MALFTPSFDRDGHRHPCIAILGVDPDLAVQARAKHGVFRYRTTQEQTAKQVKPLGMERVGLFEYAYHFIRLTYHSVPWPHQLHSVLEYAGIFPAWLLPK